MSKPLARIALSRPGTAPGGGDPLLANFTTVVDRLQGVVDFETDALSRHVAIDLAELNRQKRQGMLELSRVMRGYADRSPPAEVRDRLASLTAALDRNRAVLDVQLSAVREIAEIIAQVMKDAEWDGTYSARAAWR